MIENRDRDWMTGVVNSLLIQLQLANALKAIDLAVPEGNVAERREAVRRAYRGEVPVG